MKTSVALLSLAFAMAASAEAHQVAVELGAVPFSNNPSQTYPDAFKGVGFFGALSYNLPDWTSAIQASVTKQDGGTLSALSYHYYLVGKPQSFPSQPSVESVDRKQQPLLTSMRYFGLYAIAGFNVYQVSRTDDDGVIEVQSGPGFHCGLGVDYPLFWRLYGTARALFEASSGGPNQMIFTHVGVGFPFDF